MKNTRSCAMSIVRKPIEAFVLLLVLVLSWQQASASGAFLPATGVLNQSRGGTGIANGRDLTVLAENPAELVDIPAASSPFSSLLNYHLFYLRNRYQRTGDGPSESYPETGNVARFANNIPNIYAGSNFGVDGLYGAIGVYSPVGPSHEYDPAGAQRYSIILNKISLLWAAAGLAYKPHKVISLGASLALAVVTAEQKIGFTLIPGAYSLDGDFSFTGSDLFIPIGVFGVTIHPMDKLSIGLMYRTRFQVNLEGVANAQLPAIGLEGSDTLTISQPMPELVQGGIGWSDSSWGIEFAVKWMHWSIFKEQIIDLDNNVIGGFKIDDIITPKKYNDAFSFHLGGSYRYKDHEVRGGGFYDMGAVDPSNTTMTEYDPNKVGLTTGYGFWWKDLHFSLSYMHMFYQKVEVTDSVVKAIAPIGEGQVIGNGTYHWNVNILGGAVEYVF